MQVEERIKSARIEIRNLEHQKKSTSRSIGQLQQSLRQIHEESCMGSAAQGAALRLHAAEMVGKLEKKFCQLQSAQSCSEKSAALPSDSVLEVCEVIHNTLHDHNAIKRSLRKQLRESIAAYNDMLVYMRSRLEALGVPIPSVHAQPLRLEAFPGLIVAKTDAPAEEGPGQKNPAGALSDSKQEQENGAAVANELAAASESTNQTIVLPESCSQPHGWAITQPCVQGVDIIRAGSTTLQRLPDNLFKTGVTS